MERTLWIDGPPVAMARPRACTVGKGVRVYNSQRKEMDRLKWQLQSMWNSELINAPISIDVAFLMPIPKSTPKKIAEELIGVPHCKTPDIDNLLKHVLDGLVGSVITDDKLVYEITVSKMYSDEPGTRLIVRSMGLCERLRKCVIGKISNKSTQAGGH